MQGFVGQRLFTISSPDNQSSTDEQSQATITGSSTTTGDSVLPSNSPRPSSPSSTSSTKPSSSRTLLLTLISRRSTNRPGLRFLRRGIDESGSTANFNETEQILSPPSWIPSATSPITSFIQIRGSIPVFFTQTPYTFKPVPVLTGTDEANDRAARKHFTDLAQRYGRVKAVSLVDKHGTEANVGEAFEKRIETLNSRGGAGGKQVGFEWFDFHTVCRGMRFDRVSQLVDEESTFLDESAWTAVSSSSSSSGLTPQTGVLRTNCMDCLDRTNVVQSALAAYSLSQQLSTHYSLNLDLASDPTSTTWFNTLWADNGDAVSRAYAGTPALKGDYTRTRTRSALGALTDFGHTLARYRKGLFADGWAQAVIDYLQGGIREAAFVEFEARFQTGDPGVDVQRGRQEAIMVAADVVVGGGGAGADRKEKSGGEATDEEKKQKDPEEDLLAGHVLLTPHHASTLRSHPFSESVLLLTDLALYSVRFDWNMGKVRAFERVDLKRVRRVEWGAYITEVDVKGQMDEGRNVGFVVWFDDEDGETGDDDGPSNNGGKEGDRKGSEVRVNTRSMDTSGSKTMKSGQDIKPAKDKAKHPTADPTSPGSRFLAFKAPPQTSSILRPRSESSSDNDGNDTISSAILKPTRKTQSSRNAKSRDASPEKEGDKAGEEVVKTTPERTLVRQICGEIIGAVGATKGKEITESEEGGGDGEEVRMEEKAIISAEEAQRSTGYVERLGYGVRRLVWG